jgi:hypothetical protein
MATKMIRFVISDEDQAELDELVEYFGNGNRSAYLRATFKIMKSVKLAELILLDQCRVASGDGLQHRGG